MYLERLLAMASVVTLRFDVDSGLAFLLSLANSPVKLSSCLKLQHMNRVCTLMLLKKAQS